MEAIDTTAEGTVTPAASSLAAGIFIAMAILVTSTGMATPVTASATTQRGVIMGGGSIIAIKPVIGRSRVADIIAAAIRSNR